MTTNFFETLSLSPAVEVAIKLKKVNENVPGTSISWYLLLMLSIPPTGPLGPPYTRCAGTSGRFAEFGRGRGQHRLDSGRHFQRGRGWGGGRGGWGRGRVIGWNR